MTGKPIKFGYQGKPSNHESASSASGLYKKCQDREPRFLHPEDRREERKKEKIEEINKSREDKKSEINKEDKKSEEVRRIRKFSEPLGMAADVNK